jgi:hypothetical protein
MVGDECWLVLEGGIDRRIFYLSGRFDPIMHPIYNLPSAKTEAAPTVELRQQLEHCLSADRASLDEAFGSIRMHVSTQDAIGEHKPKSIGFFAGTLRVRGMVFRSRLDGSYKTNPFFVPETGAPFA